MTGDLLAWLRGQLDEDERIARQAGWDHPTWTYDRETFTVHSAAGSAIAARTVDGSPISDVDGEHIARWDPARALAEVEAKRRILAEQHYCDDGRNCYACSDKRGDDIERYPCPTVRLLALPYADRPGYRQEWRPDGL